MPSCQRIRPSCHMELGLLFTLIFLPIAHKCFLEAVFIIQDGLQINISVRLCASVISDMVTVSTDDCQLLTRIIQVKSYYGNKKKRRIGPVMLGEKSEHILQQILSLCHPDFQPWGYVFLLSTYSSHSHPPHVHAHAHSCDLLYYHSFDSM